MDANKSRFLHMIGERVHYYAYTHNQPLTPRPAIITGIGTQHGTVNLQVFYDHTLDAFGGGSPDSAMVGDVPLAKEAPTAGGAPWTRLFVLMPKAKPAVDPEPRENKKPERAGQAAKSP